MLQEHTPELMGLLALSDGVGWAEGGARAQGIAALQQTAHWTQQLNYVTLLFSTFPLPFDYYLPK